MQNLRKTNETGRSMVEMLGVLAIIGVLSVTGVAGYKAAVRKALANNLLNQASMRATDVATKIGSGNLEDLTNDAFDNDLGGGVTISSTVKGPDGYTDYDESDEQFTLTLEGLDEEMCQQMQSMAGGSRSVVREVECVNNADGDLVAILTFNKDLSANPVASDFTTESECKSAGKTWCSGKGASGACSNSTDCCAGYDSQCCDSETGDISSTESCTTSDGKSTTCSKGKCEFGSKDCMDKECCEAIEGSWKCTEYCRDYGMCSSSDCICIGKDENGACGSMEGCVRCDSKDEKIVWPDYGTPACVDEAAGETWACAIAACHVCTKTEGTAMFASNADIGICVNKDIGENGCCTLNDCIKWNQQNGETGACGDWMNKIKCNKEEGVAGCDQNDVCSCVDCSTQNHKVCCENAEGKWMCGDTDKCICVGKDENGICGSGRCQKCDKPEQPVVSGYRSFCVDLSTETYICGESDCVKWNKTNGETGACCDYECVSWNPTLGETGDCSTYYCRTCTKEQGTAFCDDYDGCTCQK